MAIIKVQKGTKDILPNDMTIWHFMEEKALEVFSKYGAKEIRTPIFEATELFARGVGDTTDIVNKEMYTFEKSERSLTLRPENTAGVVRSFIENGMHRLSAPVKLYPQLTKNVRVKNKDAACTDPDVLKEVEEVEKLINKKGRVLLRQSGTEPVVRVMVESEVNCEEYVDRIMNKIISKGHKAE